MAPFGSADVNEVAHRLDAKVERLLDATTKIGVHGQAAIHGSSA
jgi:hypothetical protein